jgi:hypothetical protein
VVEHLPANRFRQFLCHIGGDKAWCHGIDGYLASGHFLGQCFGQADEAGFAG